MGKKTSILFLLISVFLSGCDSSGKSEVHERASDWVTKEELADTPTSEIFNYSFSPDPNIDLWGLLELKLFVPRSLERVRGIYCYVPGWQGSSMVMIKKKSLRAYVERKGFALMTFTTEGEYTSREEGISTWSANAFLEGLKKLAEKSGHPEIENAPLLFNGHSAGGQFAYHFTLLKPERVIAFVTIKGGLHSSVPAGEATKVPGFMVIGENDEEFRKSNLTSIFKKHRPEGALWSLAMHPNTRHDPVDDAIKHAFFDAVIPLRLPKSSLPNGTTQLREVEETAAWVGNSETFSVSSYPDYQGDRSKASWLPNEDFAKIWVRFIGR